MTTSYLELETLAHERQEQFLREVESYRLADEARAIFVLAGPVNARARPSGLRGWWPQLTMHLEHILGVRRLTSTHDIF